jgi:hypothetical protein
MNIHQYTMKLHYYLVLAWGLLASLTACKHDPDAIIPDPTKPDSTSVQLPDQSGTVTEVGQPQGGLTSKAIGSQGGTITSEDGKVNLVIPAGALSKTTDITIQPITNKNSTGLGLAYRFLPEGLTFSKPATLTVQYDEKKLSSQQAENLGISYQRTDHIWYDVSGASVDVSKHEISVPMEHFSDWTPYEQAQLNFTIIGSNTGNGVEYVDLGQSIDLYAALNIYDSNYPKSQKEKPLKAKPGLGSNWNLIGEGKLVPGGSGATYTAPSTAPKQNPVLVTADLEFVGKKFKVTLICQIYVGQGTFFNVSIDNATYEAHTFGCARVGEFVYVICGAGSTQMSFNIKATDLIERVYRYGNKEAPNTVMAVFKPSDNPMDGHGFLSTYIDCAYEEITSTGGVTIDKIEVVNGIKYVTGSVFATCYQTHGVCNKNWSLEKVKITGSFRLQFQYL